MIHDHTNPERFFQGKPVSTTIFKTGKTKRKLQEIKLEIWEIYRENFDATIEGEVRNINYSYIGYKISGAIEDQKISGHFNDFSAMTALMSGIEQIFRYYEEHFGWKFYIANFAGEAWCKVTVEEIFHFLVPRDWTAE